VPARGDPGRGRGAVAGRRAGRVRAARPARRPQRAVARPRRLERGRARGGGHAQAADGDRPRRGCGAGFARVPAARRPPAAEDPPPAPQRRRFRREDRHGARRLLPHARRDDARRGARAPGAAARAPRPVRAPRARPRAGAVRPRARSGRAHASPGGDGASVPVDAARGRSGRPPPPPPRARRPASGRARRLVPPGDRRGRLREPRDDRRVRARDRAPRRVGVPPPVLGVRGDRPGPVPRGGSAGIRATGIGCYFDEPVHEVFGIRTEGFRSLYHFTFGGPVEDPRLQSHPAYGSPTP
jgi:hypothetical protein